MSQSEIEHIQQVLVKLTVERNRLVLLLSKLESQPPDSPIRAKMKIMCQAIRRIDLKTHMHERQLERLREQG